VWIPSVCLVAGPCPLTCPILQETTVSHGDERVPRSTTAPGRISWSGVANLLGDVGFETTVARTRTVFKIAQAG
jgi:hypothetical protein